MPEAALEKRSEDRWLYTLPIRLAGGLQQLEVPFVEVDSRGVGEQTAIGVANSRVQPLGRAAPGRVEVNEQLAKLIDAGSLGILDQPFDKPSE